MKNRRGGFALLMVIACILIVTVAVVSVSRSSLQLSMESADSANEVQERWERYSLERAGLVAAIEMYGGDPPSAGGHREAVESNNEESERVDWNPVYSVPIRLGDRTYRVVVADESAKANLNTLMRIVEPGDVKSTAMALSRVDLRRLMLPGVSETDSNLGSHDNLAYATIGSWGEVLEIGASAPDGIDLLDLPGMTENLTLVGDGKVNLTRASDEVLLEVSQSIISPQKSREWIDEYRQSYPKKSLATVLWERSVDAGDVRALLKLFSLRSSCVSTWVLRGQSKTDHSFSIARRSGSDSWQTETTRYTW